MKRMKRSITAATDVYSVHNGAFYDIAYDAEKLDYEMTVDDKFNMKLECTKDKEFMPTITVKTTNEDGIYYFEPDLSFPTLKYDDMEYSDSYHYWVVTKWEPVTRFLEKLCKFRYDPNDFE